MANLNVAEWTPDQVADWLEGLGPSVQRYIPELRSRGLDGTRLLMLRCDDLEYLGVHIIGHQEIILEAVEHLRNFHYEAGRECVQQLALRVSVAAGGLARALRHQPASCLDTPALALVARCVQAVKPLVCWLDRWALWSGSGGPCWRRAALLQLCLEACTSAQRERFAEQPAAAVAAAAAATAATADYIIQEVKDPLILAPASLETVTLCPRGRALGFSIAPSFGGHAVLARLRFGSPAHASAALEGDEVAAVGARCVVGWPASAVLAACEAARPDLVLRLRRRAPGPPAPPARWRLGIPGILEREVERERQLSRERESEKKKAEAEAEKAASAKEMASSSDESEPLSPPASPTHLHTRMYPPRPARAVRRRHTVCGGGEGGRHAAPPIEQFWQELQQQWARPDPDTAALYRRAKAVSCSTGLELSPRPARLVPPSAPAPPAPPAPAAPPSPPSPALHAHRARLDKSHSTPAYDLDFRPMSGGTLSARVIPEAEPSRTEHSRAPPEHARTSAELAHTAPKIEEPKSPDTDNEFRDEGDDSQPSETLNAALVNLRVETSQKQIGESRGRADVPPEPPPRPPSTKKPEFRDFPVLRVLPREPERQYTPFKHTRPLDASQISLPLRHITKHDIRVIPSERRELPPINVEPEPRPLSPPLAATPPPSTAPVATPPLLTPPTSVVRGIFPTSKSRSLKKKNSILAKRRQVAAAALSACEARGAAWQRVRRAERPRWAPRHLLLLHHVLYAFRSAASTKADCMIALAGCTVSAAGEVKSRAHAFKVYHTGMAFYFACATKEHAQAWIQLLQRATLAASDTPMELSQQFSETDYSDTESETESPEKEKLRDKERELKEKDIEIKEKERDKSKFGSLKKLTHRMQRSESSENVSHSSTSLDRKYLRNLFSRNKNKDDTKIKSKQPGVPVPTEHYRSYRRVPPAPPAHPAHPAHTAHPAPPAPPAHASNPNLLDFSEAEFRRPPARALGLGPNEGFVTLHEFMLQKQREERRQSARGRRGAGGVRGRRGPADQELRERLEQIVPDVIYGELPPAQDQEPAGQAGAAGQAGQAGAAGQEGAARQEGQAEAAGGADAGYEKIMSPAHERWRDSLRRNDKVHSGEPPATIKTRERWDAGGAGAAGGGGDGAAAWSGWRGCDGCGLARVAGAGGAVAAGGAGVSRLRLLFAHRRDAPPQDRGALAPHYPHLQCPPTFQPETYSLAAPPRAPR